MPDTQKTYLILPGCDDTNRGDQALIWETVALAKSAGYNGNYYMLAENEKSSQSKVMNINNIDYILPHPSTHFSKNDNINYGLILKIKWIAISLLDTVKALLMLIPPLRHITMKISKEKLGQALRVFECAEAAFVKGGGFLHSYGGLISTYTVFFQLYHIILALSMRINVYVMPNSFGPFDGPGSALLVKSVLKKCKVITSRESISQKTLSSCTGLQSELYPDLAFYLQPDSSLTAEQLQKLNEIPFSTQKCVALTMRPYRFPASPHPLEDYEKYKQTLCDFILHLSKSGYHPVLVEHTLSDLSHENDGNCIQDVVKLLNKRCDYSVYSDPSLNCKQLKYIYSQFKYIIGTRFHSVIFSLASGVPAIAVTYGGNKGEGIMKDIGLEHFSVKIENADFNTLSERFDSLVENEASVSAAIKKYLDQLPEKQESLINLIKG